jgi:hypothetical protein
MTQADRTAQLAQIRWERRILASEIESARQRGATDEALELTKYAHRLWQQQVTLQRG